jgi:hypothetical protein
MWLWFTVRSKIAYGELRSFEGESNVGRTSQNVGERTASFVDGSGSDLSSLRPAESFMMHEACLSTDRMEGKEKDIGGNGRS